MTAQDFFKKWNNSEENTYPLKELSLSNFTLKDSTRKFLLTAGLPESAAPMLSFVKNSEEKYSSINLLSVIYPHLNYNLDNFIVIGSDGSGSPIVINTNKEDQISLLDHDASFSEQIMNSSLEQLADCLIAYRDFIKLIQKENGEDAFLDGLYSLEQIDNLKASIRSSDINALSHNSFWNQELHNLISMQHKKFK